MKRCPQCEFTFRDDEHFCDFDGTELSAIPESRPSSQSFSAYAVLPSLVLRLVRSNFSLAVLALAGIVLNAVMVGYYSATEPESKGETDGSVAALPPPTQDVMVRLVPEDQDRNQKRPGSPEQGTRQRSAAGVGNIARMAKGQPRWAETVAGRESENAPKKKESRVIVMLKKTGRILTRPFKFLTRA